MVKTQGRRTYVLDTSVLLADPAAITRFDEHQVVLPVVVITELEAKRNHPELGYCARQALRYLDNLRVEHGRLDEELPMGALGGTVRVGAEPRRRLGAARLGSGWGTTTPDPVGGVQPGRRGSRRRAGQQGPAAARQGRLRRPGRPGVPGRAARGLGVDRDEGAGGQQR